MEKESTTYRKDLWQIKKAVGEDYRTGAIHLSSKVKKGGKEEGKKSSEKKTRLK